MYSNNKSVQHLVALLKAHGVKEVVLSPGARNMPIIQSLASDQYFTCHTAIDERSAGYYAIGLSLRNAHVERRSALVAICCTSGTAALNYAPAIAEAFFQHIPLIVLTADRPERWVGQQENQVLPQRNLFGLLVKLSVCLPEVYTKEDEWHCNRLVNEAILEAMHRLTGPVHINIPLSEPLFDMEEEDTLPNVRVIRRLSLERHSEEWEKEYEALAQTFGKYKSHMLILGQGDYGSSPLSVESSALETLHASGCIILAEHLANNLTSSCIIRNFDAVLNSISEKRWETYTPELLITTGGHIVSKQLKKFLRQNAPKAHWSLSPSGEIIDTYQCLTNVVETHPGEFIDKIIHSDILPSFTLQSQWNKAVKLPAPAPAYSDFMAIGELMKSIPDRAIVFLGNSMSIRLAHLYPIDESRGIRFYANRGLSGIDGNLSTATGLAAAGDTTFILVGDMAFYYDMNAIISSAFNRQSLRIFLNNNEGCEIFHTLPGFRPTRETEQYITMKRKSSAREWALERGFIYLPVTNEAELKESLSIFVDKDASASVLLEVFSNMEQNVEELDKYYQSLRKHSEASAK
ncbi:MAG: 2-succinyl-5-enolpyruvyl-6-hydroxy-3-cyclohexene-1-carboxylic-acid synthase [Tannerellaceae bacterium]|jgi:2-succinyl-5-enolpyruvyl-6-hydroxy-3-cyclohexene-1-carboxylate synthase|nr:2-succinyl-5-enolpyruvyl-6-hydroxy-3-cyclohexene-1-carboxylic-acid synthase [Tannerellaceae bacterium]